MSVANRFLSQFEEQHEIATYEVPVKADRYFKFAAGDLKAKVDIPVEESEDGSLFEELLKELEEDDDEKFSP